MKYLIALLFLSGCCNHNDSTSIDTSGPFGMNKYYDKKHNIVCYTHYSHGISCVKLAEAQP
jgi:hypothetical protein